MNNFIEFDWEFLSTSMRPIVIVFLFCARTQNTRFTYYCYCMYLLLLLKKKYSPLDCRCQTFEAKKIYITKILAVFLLLFSRILYCDCSIVHAPKKAPAEINITVWFALLLSIDLYTNDKKWEWQSNKFAKNCFFKFQKVLCFFFFQSWITVFRTSTKW